MSVIYQMMNIFIILLVLGAPVIVTILLLRHFGKPADHSLAEKVKQLEKRIEALENEINNF